MSKFNKAKCAKCKFRCNVSASAGAEYKQSNRNIGCYYGELSHKGTCLQIQDGKLVDRRGDDYNNCKLYEKGNRDPQTYGY